ncbi:acyl-CoA N-acyltransferase [Aspergillus crustosus]
MTHKLQQASALTISNVAWNQASYPNPPRSMTDFKVPSELFRSNRLIYRAIEDTDEDQTFLYSHMNEPAMHLLSGPLLPRPRTRQNAVGFLGSEERLLAIMICLPPPSTEPEPTNPQRAPTEKPETSPTPIGHLTLTSKYGSINAHHRHAEMGLSITTPQQGKGFGREAITWAIDWAFRYANLHRVGIEVFAFNEAALGLYTSVRFLVEGRAREAVWVAGGWRDVISLGVLEREWLILRGSGEALDVSRVESC